MADRPLGGQRRCIGSGGVWNEVAYAISRIEWLVIDIATVPFNGIRTLAGLLA